MALRLFLVGIVASLALDLPYGKTASTPTGRRYDSTSLIAGTVPVPDAGRFFAVAVEPTTETVAPPAIELPALADAVKPVLPIVATPPATMVEPILPTAPVVADAAPAFEKTPAPMPTPMPAPSVVESTPRPTADAAPAPAPIPTIATVEPTTATELPANVFAPEAPAPAPIVVVAPDPEPVVAPAPVVVEAPAPVDPDAAFTKIVSTMASSFAADFSAPKTDVQPLLAKAEPIATPAVIAPPPATAADEIAEVVPDLYPGIAFALNRQAEGITPMPVIEAAPEDTKVAAAPEPEPVPVPEPIAETVASPTGDESPAERLANAVKLTGQAMNAWAGLLSQRPAVTAIQR